MKNESKVEKINDYNGRDYRTVWEHPRAAFENRFEGGLIRRLLTRKPGWFIDVGGGYGRVYPDYKMVGRKVVLVDYALNLLEMADKKYSDDKDLYFVAANAYHLPFKDRIFSGAISIRVFHHINLPEKFMKEFSRIMANGGEALIEYANKRNLFRILRRGQKSLMADHEEYEPLHYGTHPVYFDKIATAEGLETKRTNGTGFFPRFIKEKTKFLSPLFFVGEKIFDFTFGRIGMGPLHFSLLKKKGNESVVPLNRIEDILQCPICGGKLDLSDSKSVRCLGCQHSFAKHGRILDLRYSPASGE